METGTVKVVFIGADLQMADMVGQRIRLRWSGVTPLVATTTSDGLSHVVGHQRYVGDAAVLHVNHSPFDSRCRSHGDYWVLACTLCASKNSATNGGSASPISSAT